MAVVTGNLQSGHSGPRIVRQSGHPRLRLKAYDAAAPAPVSAAPAPEPAEVTRETGGKTENTRKSALTDLERAMIALEKRHWKYQGTKEKAITALGLTPIAYYQKLNTMIDSQRVIAAEPILMHRLREVRDRS